MNIEELLRPTREFVSKYHFYIKRGIKYLQTQNICIVGLTRNTANIIDNTLNTFVNIGSNAKNYKIVLFENDSTDHTKTTIENRIKNNPNISLISEQYNRPQFGQVQSTERTKALSEYRNKLKQYIQEQYANYDYVIVTDTDFESISLNGIYNSFGWLASIPTIGAICGNSFEYKHIFSKEHKSLWNYDSWAYRGTWWNNLQTHNGADIRYDPMMWFGIHILPVGSDPIRINSGFGGMAIYKTNFFLMGNYSGHDCEHVMFHHDIFSKDNNFNLFLNPSQTMLLSSEHIESVA